MAADKLQQILRKIPSVDQITSDSRLKPLIEKFGHDHVVETARQVLAQVREQIRGSKSPSEEPAQKDSIVQRLIGRLEESTRYQMGRAVNATGIVLHTGLGRAVIASSVMDAINQELRGYSILEVNRSTGERSIREEHVAKLLCKLTGAEAATVVNNNAGGTMLALAALCSGREAIVSRSQLVEIGGSFRIPDVMSQSGCKLVEVGTTNKTYLADYEKAMTPNTGLLMHVHTSNYRIIGFTQQVEIEELVAFGHKRNLPVMDDLGSGSLVDLAPYGILDEPAVQRSVRSGADVITFSGDKLLGGPQSGLIVGNKKTIGLIRKHPLFRALRPGKFTLLALEATLRLYQNPDTMYQQVPTLHMLTLSKEELESRALKLAARLKPIDGLSLEILDDTSEAGGGSMPAHPLPTKVVALKHRAWTLQELAQKLRDYHPPIFTRVQRDRVLLDVRTLLEGDAEIIAAALSAL
jgi:L-seryl-tRNA(Ser) seleniumtransferase